MFFSFLFLWCHRLYRAAYGTLQRWWARWLRWMAPPAPAPEPEPDREIHPAEPEPSPQARHTAVHEAGHLIAAWYCTEVVTIHSVTIVPDPHHENGGKTVCLFNQHARTPYCFAVIALGGAAAEIMTFGKMRSGGCKKDLLEIRDFLDGLEEPWPWKIHDQGGTGPTLPFKKIFTLPPTRHEHETLLQAYKLARKLLVHYAEQHDRITRALLKHATLNETQLETILGKRGFMWRFWSLVDPGFILPTEEKEAA
jgi:hypothetical protein